MNIKSGATQRVFGIITGTVFVGALVCRVCRRFKSCSRKKGAGIGALGGAAVGGLMLGGASSCFFRRSYRRGLGLGAEVL